MRATLLPHIRLVYFQIEKKSMDSLIVLMACIFQETLFLWQHVYLASIVTRNAPLTFYLECLLYLKYLENIRFIVFTMESGINKKVIVCFHCSIRIRRKM